MEVTTTQTDRLSSVSSLAIKAPCVVATTANITLSGLQTIDGVGLAEGDRVLVKSQTDAKNNGIWLASATAWERAADFDGAYDTSEGTIVRVNGGSTSSGAFFLVGGSYTIGTDNIAFYNLPAPVFIPTPSLFDITSGSGVAADDTAAIIACLKAYGKCYLWGAPSAGYWSITAGSITPGANSIPANAAIIGEGGLQNVYTSGVAQTIVKLSGTGKLFDLTYANQAVFRDIYCDGTDRASGKIAFSGNTVASANCVFDRVTVARFDYGFGDGVNLMRSAEFSNCRADANNYGFTMLLDCQVIGGTAIANKQHGVWLKSGAWSNQFAGFRSEWNEGRGVLIDGVQDNTFASCLIDRSYGNGLEIIGAAINTRFSGIIRRNGRAGVAGQRSNLYIAGTATHCDINANMPTGYDDDGITAQSPYYGVEFAGTPDHVRIVGGSAQGTNAAINEGWSSQPGHYMYQGVQGITDTSFGYGVRDDAHGEYYTYRSALSVANGGTANTTLSGLVSMTTIPSRKVYRIVVYVRNSTTGGTYGASFMMVAGREAGGGSYVYSAAFAEIGTAGTIAINGAAAIRLDISNVATDASSADVLITNTLGHDASVSIRVVPV